MNIEGIYTIGYGERTFEQFSSLLENYQIDYLIDVRSKPFSKFKPEFSKAPLEYQLNLRKIRYVFMGDLLGGQPDDDSCYTEGKVDYKKIQEKDFYQQGIKRLKTAFDKNCRVVLMCSEMKPQDCHRSKLIGETLTNDLGIPMFHIDEDGEIKSQEKVVSLLTNGQYEIFNNFFTSRKSYKKQDPQNDESY
ncbi:MAG: DUF488 domain-containing protein [Saprospiraceae bacterium]|nr:DUF488 domain-containing protein [Saprospiraceae bacterium]